MSPRKQKIKDQNLRSLSAPLTRSPIPPLPFMTPGIPWLYSAILGNGHVLVCLDEAGSIAQIFYPNIDVGPHVRSFLTGFQAVDSNLSDTIDQNPDSAFENKIETLTSGEKDTTEVSWLVDENWTHQLRYIEGTAVISDSANNSALGLHVERTMAVHPDNDVFTTEIKVTNHRPTPVDCKHVVYAGFDIDNRKSNNCCFFDIEVSRQTFFSTDRYATILCDASVIGFSSEKSDIDGVDSTFQNTSKGNFTGREYAIGQVSGAICYDFGRIEPGASIIQHMNLCFGRSLEQVITLSNAIEKIGVSIKEIITWWRKQPVHSDPGASLTIASSIYDRSLITLQLLTDGETGSIIASPESDPDYQACGGYGACWPRDGAFIGHALDVAGRYEQARAFYDWTLRIQTPSGVWYQRYHMDGKLAPTWGLVQFDETGAVVWSICRHIQISGDSSYGQRVFPQLIRACEYMHTRLDPETGLAPHTKDLWEERDGISTYACASTWAGFHELSTLAMRIGEHAAARRWASAADDLKSAIEKYLWDSSQERFLRGIRTRISSQDAARLRSEPGYIEADIREVDVAGRKQYLLQNDTTIDTSILGLSIPFGVFAPDDPRMLATADAVAKYLLSPVGGIRRYQSDPYRGGNPWIICTLWLALQDIASGRKERAYDLYNWVLEHRTPLDLLSEQVDRVTGKPCWIVPLGWSHAMFILASQAMAEHGLLPK